MARAIRRGRLGLKDPRRPVGCFLLLGPTGVGKTQLCRSLARTLFGSEEALLRFDMSEYMESHSVSRLIGSPPGYVGHEEGGQLTERVRRKPWSVVLLDELEKAHRDVWSILLQVMEEGVLTDAQGRKTDFRNTVLVMTSNLGARHFHQKARLGFSQGPEADRSALEQAVLREARNTFAPEFFNRLDAALVFHPLDGQTLAAITQQMLSQTGGTALRPGDRPPGGAGGGAAPGPDRGRPGLRRPTPPPGHCRPGGGPRRRPDAGGVSEKGGQPPGMGGGGANQGWANRISQFAPVLI